MKKFPTNSLAPQEASFWALLFENRRTSLPLGLYWSFSVQCSPLTIDGASYDCSLSADWLRIPGIRDWRALDGFHASGNWEVVEASLYTQQHDPVVQSDIRLARVSNNLFRLQWSGIVDFEDWGDPELDPKAEFSVDVSASFDGVFIHPCLIEGSTDVQAVAHGLVAPISDLNTLQSVERHTNKFGVEQFMLRARPFP